MEITINIEDPMPLFTQLVEQIKSAVISDKVRPGDPLPSIRQLANDLELNSKTIAKAYKLLERDLVIQSKGYRGTFVHPDAIVNSKMDLNADVLAQLDNAISACKTAGVTDSEIRIAFSSAMNSKNN
ncbi:GntR family transcriptional regulator [Colwellia sp. BRX8-4]|uniref:GntR family transcriptional regulator n=1 Tax=Colwellia sp. BRX8-4 TaxID=2759836 RepID=UPI0015F4ECF1|nr:GntR family transcriptional regulator [Colwellia sp. BRX8-4]MBA6372580.1 GntR family transcriptional regulator [Colwellia sp. BRX8-4]